MLELSRQHTQVLPLVEDSGGEANEKSCSLGMMLEIEVMRARGVVVKCLFSFQL